MLVFLTFCVRSLLSCIHYFFGLVFLISPLIFCSDLWAKPSQESVDAPPTLEKGRSLKPKEDHSKTGKTQGFSTKESNLFYFGSYGRVGLSSDLNGGEGQKRQITPYAPRLIEDNYLELDLGYRVYQGSHGDVTVLTTLAAFDEFFHYNGTADAQLAIRRAYVEVDQLAQSKWWLSLGSRWLRGNDIYLMNFWPLDDLNTMGFTAGHRGPLHELWFHVGVSRLDHRSQTQYVSVPAASNFGADSVLRLNRQRLILASLFERRYRLKSKAAGWKWKLYAEYHTLPSGKETLDGGFSDQRTLPDDAGLLAGFQLGLWGLGHPSNHLNLWARYGRGLAIYDELGTATAFNREKRSWDAEEWRLALAGNWGLTRSHLLSIQWGGYLRHYRDADEITIDYDDRVEGSLVVRPQLNIKGFFTPAIEGSAQWSQAQGQHPVDLSTQSARIYQFALIPAFSFGEKPLNAYTRPQLRLIYAVSLLNEAALARYATEDPKQDFKVAHYLGARAEWWFGRGGGY